MSNVLNLFYVTITHIYFVLTVVFTKRPPEILVDQAKLSVLDL